MALAKSFLFFIPAASAVLVIVFAYKDKAPVRKCFVSSLCGIAALGLVNLLSGYTGVSIVFNYFSTAAAVVLGLPGVILLLILRVVLIL